MNHELTADSDVALDPQRQEAARGYAGQKRRLILVDLALGAVLVLGFLLSGGSRWLRDLLTGAGVTSPWALVPLYFAIVYVAYDLLSVPLSYYSGFILPHRYGLSTQSTRGWLMDQLKSLGLGLVLGGAVMEVIYWLLRSYPDTWWVWAGVVLLALTLLLGLLAPVLILPLFYKLKPLEDPELTARIRRLAEAADTRIAGVYTMNLSSRTTAANAMFMGMGSTKRIALGDTLYKSYSPDEIETIVAHELGHQVHKDLWSGTVVQAIVLVGTLYLAQLFLHWGVARFGFAGPGDVAALPLLALAAGIFSLVTMPLLNGYSRWRESRADDFALATTHNGPAFARAFIRLANQNLSEFDPPAWVVWLLYSHPPISERVRKAEAAGMPG